MFRKSILDLSELEDALDETSSSWRRDRENSILSITSNTSSCSLTKDSLSNEVEGFLFHTTRRHRRSTSCMGSLSTTRRPDRRPSIASILSQMQSSDEESGSIGDTLQIPRTSRSNSFSVHLDTCLDTPPQSPILVSPVYEELRQKQQSSSMREHPLINPDPTEKPKLKAQFFTNTVNARKSSSMIRSLFGKTSAADHRARRFSMTAIN